MIVVFVFHQQYVNKSKHYSKTDAHILIFVLRVTRMDEHIACRSYRGKISFTVS